MNAHALPLFECNGHLRTVKEWASITGISSYEISRRIRQGWSIERIVAETEPTYPPNAAPISTPMPAPTIEDASPKAKRSITHAGRTMTIKEWSAETDLSESLIRWRLGNAWGVDRALTERPGTYRELIGTDSKPVGMPRYEGRLSAPIYQHDGLALTAAQWAARLGISKASLNSRLALGWPIAKALTQPVEPSKVIEHDGKSHTMKEWSELTGLSVSSLYGRLKAGWSVDQTLTTPSRHIMGPRAVSRLADAAMSQTGAGPKLSRPVGDRRGMLRS